MKPMRIEVEQRHIDLLKTLTLHGHKLTGLKYNLAQEDRNDDPDHDLRETLLEAGLIYPCIENSETGRRALHITIIGRKILQELDPRNKRLEDIELSVRTFNAFKAAKMDTLGDILELGMDKLKFIVGNKSFIEMDAVLFEQGLTTDKKK